MSIQQGQEGKLTVGWQNTPTPECFAAISGRTCFGLKMLPVCNFSKQKHWSAYAEAEKGIKLKYYCCFADNHVSKLCQHTNCGWGSEAAQGCPAGARVRSDLHRYGFPIHAMNFLSSAEAFIHTRENTPDWLKPDPWCVALMDKTPIILGPKVLPSFGLQRAGDDCCPPHPASLVDPIFALRAALAALSGATGH